MIKKLILTVIMGVILWNGCVTTHNQKSNAEYQREIEHLKLQLKENPTDFGLLRDLGKALYELGKYKSARKALLKAFKLDPNDAETMTYLGMTLEAEKQNVIALKIYKRYTKTSKLSPHRGTLAMRYRLLSRNMLREEMRELLKNEQTLNVSHINPKSIAIFPMTYQGDDNTYSPLGNGFSEMIITDLSQVHDLEIIERVRLQALFEEMSLQQSGIVDETTAPRFGKLLGAAKIVHGNYDVLDGSNLQLNIGFWDVFNDQAPGFTNHQDNLEQLFQLEKDFVFNLLDEMSIELTPQERQRIQHIPTQNLQAFMNYCVGLSKEDAGQFEEAAKYYQLSLNMDPQFKMASKKLSNTRILASADQANMQRPAGNGIGYPGSPAPGNSLINNRLHNLNNNMGSFFIPGQENRESAEEAQSSGMPAFDDLPAPPAPPPRPR